MTLLKRAGIALACALVLAAPAALAQKTVSQPGTTVPQTVVGYGAPGATATPVTDANGLPVNCISGCGGGGGGGSTEPFTPAGNATLAASTTSSRVALPSADDTTLVQNLGASTAYVVFGGASVTAATTATPVAPGMAIALDAGANTHLAAITASGSTSLAVTTGTGLPAFGLALDNSAAAVDYTLANGAAAPFGAGAVTANTPRVTYPSDAPGLGASAASYPSALSANGCRGSTTVPTAVSDGQMVAERCDEYGGRITWPFAARSNLLSGVTAAMTGTTSTAVTGMGAPGAGLFNYVTTIVCGNAHATVGTNIELQDGNGGTTFWTLPAAAAYGGSVISLSSPLKQPTANTALYVKNSTTGANTICSFAGFKAP